MIDSGGRIGNFEGKRTGAGSSPSGRAFAGESSEADIPVRTIYGVGATLEERLSSLGIRTVRDLLYHLPRKYLDRSNVTPIGSVKSGQEVTVVGTVRTVTSRKTRHRKEMLAVDIYDGTGYMSGIWFNQPYHAQRLKEGTQVAFSGKAAYKYNMLQMINPEYDIIANPGSTSGVEQVHTGRIIPLYPCTAGITSAMLRRLVNRALRFADGIPDPVPDEVKDSLRLVSLPDALKEVHFPGSARALRRARLRLVFDEIFLLQVGLAYKKRKRQMAARGIAHSPPGDMVKRFIESLPFKLTGAQKRCWSEIVQDMTSPYQMNRLLQGEVASGKTVVAVLALLLAIENRFQGALMVPSEVLASQHAEKISSLLEKFPVRIELLTSGSPEALAKEVSRGEVDLVVGTHALIQERVSFKRLGLVVIDEQHRFGIRQRVTLAAKGVSPDILHLSATPIPRTLALTLYGDLDISVIDELPSGRKGVVTVVADESQRKGVLARVRKEIEKGRQAYVICARVEDSKEVEAKSAETEARTLKTFFPDLRIGLLHGQMSGEEKREAIRRFTEGDIDILVTTIIVEVGVDVPNATVAIVENAHLFGLAQLHQLRGRVGRGTDRGVCVFFADPKTTEAVARIEAIRKLDNGFELAEADLKIRGEGTLFGLRQSGSPDLRLARISRNPVLIRKAREAAFRIVDLDPEMKRPESRSLMREVERRFSGKIDWLFVS